MDQNPSQITHLLHAWRDGDADALERLTPLVYRELHKIARQHMRREKDGHSLQTTALVNEVYASGLVGSAAGLLARQSALFRRIGGADAADPRG